jgi:hypothetical protein
MDLVDAVGGAPFYGVRYHAKNFTLEGSFPLVYGAPTAGRGQRRKHLDEVLFSNGYTRCEHVSRHTRGAFAR